MTAQAQPTEATSDLMRRVAELHTLIAHLQPVGKIGEIQRLFDLKRPEPHDTPTIRQS